MGIIHRFTKPLSGKIPLLVGTGILLLGVLALPFLLSRTSHEALATGNTLRPFTITSPEFRDGGPLSKKNEINQFGCTGSNIAPELDWKNVPSGTKSFVLLMSDYDAPLAGGFHHWIVYNITANVRHLQGNHAFTEGTTSYGFIGYGGPCPPATGETHHYLFLLYAINITHVGNQGLKFGDVIIAIRGHVLGATSIIGTFHLPQ
jgi:Raf kinase inhibitor-like YbhB/YbcL family protein